MPSSGVIVCVLCVSVSVIVHVFLTDISPRSFIDWRIDKFAEQVKCGQKFDRICILKKLKNQKKKGEKIFENKEIKYALNCPGAAGRRDDEKTGSVQSDKPGPCCPNVFDIIFSS